MGEEKRRGDFESAKRKQFSRLSTKPQSAGLSKRIVRQQSESQRHVREAHLGSNNGSTD